MKTKNYTRRDFLQTMGIGAASFIIPGCMGSQASKTPSAKRPNVVLVMTDDQGYGDLSCHGNPVLKTPNLDKLYSQSVRLTDFHVDPCCAPTRSALLTGRYSTRVGVWHTIQGRSLLRGDEVTIADVFSGNGYRTAMFGKWHLGTSYPFRPHDRGFHEALYHGGGAIGNTPDLWDNTYYDDTYFRNGKPEKCQGYCADVWFDEAIKFIRTNKNRPFFCYLSTNTPHGPLRADSKYVEPYLGKVPEHTARFDGMVANLDENMARLVKELKGLGLEENTIFIFMTDNGTCPWVGSIRTDDDGFITEGYNAGMRRKDMGLRRWPSRTVFHSLARRWHRRRPRHQPTYRPS